MGSANIRRRRPLPAEPTTRVPSPATIARPFSPNTALPLVNVSTTYPLTTVDPAATRVNVMVATCRAFPLFVDAGSPDRSCTWVDGEPMVGVTVYGHPLPEATALAAITELSKLMRSWNPVSEVPHVFTRTGMSNVVPMAPTAADANGPPLLAPRSMS